MGAVVSPGESLLELHLRAYKIPFEREVELIPARRWRVDFLIGKWVVEVEGGIHQVGRHQRASGFSEDCLKYNALTIAGYRVLRFTTAQVKSGLAIDTIRAVVE